MALVRATAWNLPPLSITLAVVHCVFSENRERMGRMTDQASSAESWEVNWQLDSTTVYGTFVRPAGPGPFPAVVMVAGSGPTDRDWNSPLLPGSNGSARLLAEALAQAGIASLRYDKRAAGPHARENMAALIGKMSMQSHVDELTGAVRTMVQQDFIRHDRIFALTNSEGALHALHYQVQRPALLFAGLVLTARPDDRRGGGALPDSRAGSATQMGMHCLRSTMQLSPVSFRESPSLGIRRCLKGSRCC